MTPIRVRLKELREQKKWTQGRLGLEAGVRQATISEIERGKKQRLDFDILDRLAQALGVEPGDLLEREAKKRRQK